ncbi:hypothetical protein Aperf_G00000050605 [Anoplocephala perfoliata]
MAQTPAAAASHSPHPNPNLSQFSSSVLDSATFGTHWTPLGLRTDEPDSSSALHPTYALLSTPSNLQHDNPQFFQKLPNHQLNPSGSSNSNAPYFPAIGTGGEYYSPQPSSSSSAFNQMPSQTEQNRQLTDLDMSVGPLSRSTGGVSLPGFTSPESAFYQYQNRMEGQLCQICGELAAGFHHGAYVCEACKKFFMRHSLANGRSTTTCPSGGNCVIAKNSRGRCQQCRYKKCLEVGMSLKADMDAQGELDISNIPCRVCGGRSSGFHFGALTCEGCKPPRDAHENKAATLLQTSTPIVGGMLTTGFFRRTEETSSRLVCVGGKDDCTITPRSRNFVEIRINSISGRLQSDALVRLISHDRSCEIRLKVISEPANTTNRLGTTFQVNDLPFHRSHARHFLRLVIILYCQSDNTCNPNVGLDLYSDDSPLALLPSSTDIQSLPLHLHPHPFHNACMHAYGHQTTILIVFVLVLGSRIGRQPNAVKFHCAIEIRQMQDSGQPLASDFGHLPRKHSSVPTPASSSVSPSSSSQTTATIGGITGGGLTDLPQRRASAGACDMATYAASTVPRRKASAPVKMETSSVLGSHLAAVTRAGSVQAPTPLTTVVVSPPVSTSSSAAAAAAAAAAATAAVTGVVGTDEEILVDGLNWFNYGMRMAMEFMRLPATYFKSRFDMSTIEASQADDEHQIWDHVMNHFHLHSQQVVQFAKLIPGFNQMSLSARGHLVRASLYSEVLLMLSRDYDATEDRYNFMDFSPAERDVILRHFPIYNRVVEHLKISGRFFQQLNLTHTEFVYACAIGILRHYFILSNPAYTDARKLLLLARHSLLATMRTQTESPELVDHKWNRLEALNEMLSSMSKEYREIAQQLQRSRPDLRYPDLYVEMYEINETGFVPHTLTHMSALTAQSTTDVANTTHFPSASTLIQRPVIMHPPTSHIVASPHPATHWSLSSTSIKSEDPNWLVQGQWNGGTPSMTSANPYQISSFLDANHPPTQP